MDSLKIQRDVVDAVAERGYREGWSAEQFLIRQLLKLIEEAAEVMRHFESVPQYYVSPTHGSYRWMVSLDRLACVCREIFDQVSSDDWEDFVIEHPGHLVWELYDLQVVLFNMAAALGEMIGPFDLAVEARNKALQDVERGVRGGEEAEGG